MNEDRTFIWTDAEPDGVTAVESPGRRYERREDGLWYETLKGGGRGLPWQFVVAAHPAGVLRVAEGKERSDP